MTKLSTSRISAALQRARRRQVADKTAVIQAVLRTEHLSQPDVMTLLRLKPWAVAREAAVAPSR